jgi:demethylmenaquinone methyltransferase/2-methoxy-6-polyprenyl-1,4-benzoquinol methylase
MGKISALNPEAEWFGFARVKPEEKTARVRDVFAAVADRYDLMNDLMSGGLHRLWKNRLVAMMDPRPGQALLDVAGGTGDIAFRCARRTDGQARVTVCDINPAMLRAGRARTADHGWLHGENGIAWLAGNAETLPVASRSVDTVCIAFGLRNVTRIDAALAEFVRVLRPGGRVFCLEFSPGVAPGLKPLYDRYCLGVLPLLGRAVAGNEDAYRYLAESIRRFPPQKELARRMEKAGLAQARWLNLSGGIAVIHSAWRL